MATKYRDKLHRIMTGRDVWARRQLLELIADDNALIVQSVEPYMRDITRLNIAAKLTVIYF